MVVGGFRPFLVLVLAVVSFIPCLLFYSRHFARRTESFAFRNRRPRGDDHFLHTRNTIACLRFDHVQ